jgi:hypothetical protein
MYITSAGCKAPITIGQTVVFYIHLLFIISQNFAPWIFVNLSKFRINASDCSKTRIMSNGFSGQVRYTPSTRDKASYHKMSSNTLLSRFQYRWTECTVDFSDFKGIFQPFELGGVTRLIRSAVKILEGRQFKKKIFNDTNSREELKTN